MDASPACKCCHRGQARSHTCVHFCDWHVVSLVGAGLPANESPVGRNAVYSALRDLTIQSANAIRDGDHTHLTTRIGAIKDENAPTWGVISCLSVVPHRHMASVGPEAVPDFDDHLQLYQ